MGNRQHFGIGAAQVFEQRLSERLGGGLGIRQRDCQDRIRAKLGFGLGAIQCEHDAIYGQLIERIDSFERRANFIGDVLDRFGNAFAQVAFLSPSRNSSASCSPVLAPEGNRRPANCAAARMTSTSTVGLPRESRISRA